MTEIIRDHHAELEAMARDAARYRALRSATDRDWCVTRDNPRGGFFQLVGPALDAAIDAMQNK